MASWLILLLGLLGHVTIVTSQGAGGANVQTYYWQRAEVYTTFCISLTSFFSCDKTRYHAQIAYRCYPNWQVATAGDVSCTEAFCWGTWDWCQNGGTCESPDYCLCGDNWYSPRCEHCTLIANCDYDQYLCTTPTDQSCKRCDYQFAVPKEAYIPIDVGGLPSRECQQQCSWRPDSKQCFPGTCDGPVDTCTCAEGYADNTHEGDCMTITETPDITHCIGRMYVTAAGVVEDFVETSCDDLLEPYTKYTNLPITTVGAEWLMMYQGPDLSVHVPPYYIHEYEVGVAYAAVEWTLTTYDGQTVLDSSVINCSLGATQDTVVQVLHECQERMDMAVVPLHSNVLTLQPNVLNGGFLIAKDFDTGVESAIIPAKQYYTGSELRHSTNFTFDFIKPYHCSVEGTNMACTENMLDRGPAITKEGSIDIIWDGWFDDLAQIALHEVEVFQLTTYGDILGYRTQTAHMLEILAHNVSIQPLDVTEPGVYCVKLFVEDHGGNYEVARRFFIFDDVNEVELSPHLDERMWVQSGVNDTDFLWVDTLDEDLYLWWHGHFFNEFHRTHLLLNEIEADSVPINAGYEELTGQPPETRSMEAIPNVNAILRFDSVFLVDHEGGRSIFQPPPPEDWTRMDDWLSETWLTPVPREDGDSVRMWVRAWDVMDNNATDSILVHVDSSGPSIDDVWMVRHGVERIVVHHSLDFSETNVEFNAYDYHSGLHTIHWELHDYQDPTIVHGDGYVPVRKVGNDTCTAPLCYCIPKDYECYEKDYTFTPDFSKLVIPEGNHDFDYYYVITVINGARLVNVYKFHIAIDVTPPNEGLVHDGTETFDVDYQMGTDMHAYWMNFFDRESGVVFYQYGFGEECLTSSAYGIPDPADISSVNETFGMAVAPGDGIYFFTVVAYNAALEPSKPVCSDGVIIDNTPPTIERLSMDDVSAVEGLSYDGTDLWFVDSERLKWKVPDVKQACIDVADTSLNMTLMDYKEFDTTQDAKLFNASFDCEDFGAPGDMVFMTTESQLHVRWHGDDTQSGIKSFEVGLGSTDSSAEDIMPFTDTSGHRHFITYHPNLVHSEVFYVHVRATNKAGGQNEQAFGPYMVTSSVSGPPTFAATLMLSIETDAAGEEYLYTAWTAGDYYSTEVATGYIESIKFKIDDTTGGSTLVPFNLLHQSDSVTGICDWTDPPKCIAVPLSSLNWDLHGAHEYHLTLLLTSVGGHNRWVRSEAYLHYSGPPLPGMVLELDMGGVAPNEQAYDIDQQSDASQLHVTFYGFHHGTEVIQYEIGVGTAPDTDDVRAFASVGTAEGEQSITGLSLTLFEEVFTVIRATTTDGSTVVSSDGITILPVNEALGAITVSDGLRCTDADPQSLNLEHHESLLTTAECDADAVYSTSFTTYSAFWDISADKLPHVRNVKWELQVQNGGSWDTVVAFTDLGLATSHIQSRLSLGNGLTYRSAVQPCHADGCFSVEYSDGVTVLPDAPPVGSITVATLAADNEALSVEMDLDFSAPGMVSSGMDVSYCVYVDTSEGRHLITEWLQAAGWTGNAGAGKLSFSVSLPSPVEVSECLHVAVRVQNPAGLSSTSRAELTGCTEDTVTEHIVIDAVGEQIEGKTVMPIVLEKNAQWMLPDAEFTPSTHMLSATWPSLRHGNYKWKILSADAISRWAYKQPSGPLAYETFGCTDPETVRCGTTEENYANIGSIPLVDGNRYYVCVKAEETVLEFQDFIQTLAAVSACSNGITVDHDAPTAGNVWVGGPTQHQSYQTDRHSVHIYWSDFSDVENYGSVSFHTGIASYEVAVGTLPGSFDLLTFTNVGAVNAMVAKNILLEEGQAYYVTVRAIDYAGHSTEAGSLPFVADTTQPELTGAAVGAEFYYTEAVTTLSVDWDAVFEDREDDVLKFAWCVGSAPGFCDVVSLASCLTSTIAVNDPPTLDGHYYYVTVHGTNGAGLRSSRTSAALLKDSSPPVIGGVLEIKTGETIDTDYQLSQSSISLLFTGVYDPHSAIISQHLHIGSCPQCDDVLLLSNVGLVNEMTIPDLRLASGYNYYSTLTVCNAVHLCTSVSSDGVTPDPTPPNAGKIEDGLGPIDLDISSSSDFVSCNWFNVHDSESGVNRIEIRMGTTPGGNDVLAAKSVHGGTSATFVPDSPPSDGVAYYTTLAVWNNAGQLSEVTSNGIRTDSTAPAFTADPSLLQTDGTLTPNTQVYLSSVRVGWEVEDTDSYIMVQYVSLVPAQDGVKVDTPTAKIPGQMRSHTFSNVTLADGCTYYVHVISCDAAKLCVKANTPLILVDNSPPFPGSFAVQTIHPTNQSRHRDGSMLYDNASPSSITLAWLGFDDPHSQVTQYLVRLGRGQGSGDLTHSETAIVSHSTADLHEDEGYVQEATFYTTATLWANSFVFATIWAQNQAGLLSDPLYGSFLTIPAGDDTGTLDLLRRCDVHSCLGHCVCAPHGTPFCDRTFACEDVSALIGYADITVFDIGEFTDTAPDVDTVHSQCVLMARWEVAPGGRQPFMVEWTVGIEGSEPGQGVFSIHQPFWRKAEMENKAMFTTGMSLIKDLTLEPHVPYIFYLRTWFDPGRVEIFSSDGIQTDTTAPETSSSRRVKEMTDMSLAIDLDFIAADGDLIITWIDVFRDAQATLYQFEVCIGTYPGGNDVYTQMVAGDVESLTLAMADMSLITGILYHTSVKAYNEAGLTTLSYGDGFQTDATPPNIGLVWDGASVQDVVSISVTNQMSVSFSGFTDDESYIDHYIWCAGSTGEENIVLCHNIGLHLSSTKDLNFNLWPGLIVYNTIYAVNGAGMQSVAVRSNGVIIDTTPPLPGSSIRYLDNIVTNPDFSSSLSGWSSTSVTSDADSDGIAFVILADPEASELAQTLMTEVKRKYRVIFSTRPMQSTTTAAESYLAIDINAEHFVVVVSQAVEEKEKSKWTPQHVYFTATTASTDVTVSLHGNQGAVELSLVTVEPVEVLFREGEDSRDAITVEVQPQGDRSSVTAQWMVEDTDTPYITFMWALGYVAGGTQVQDFTSVGKSSHGSAYGLSLQQGAELYVTVVAYNAAGLYTRFVSHPVIIDNTPPALCCLEVMLGSGAVQYVGGVGTQVTLQWQVEDPETDVHYCQYGLGHLPNSTDIQDFTSIDSFSAGTINLPALSHGDTFHAMVRCYNYAPLEAVTTSQPVHVVLEASDVAAAIVHVVPRSVTHFPTRGNYQSVNNSVIFGWSGVNDMAGVSNCEVKLSQGASDLTSWVSVAPEGQLFSSLHDLTLTSDLPYTVSLKVTNHAGLTSNVFSEEFMVEAEPPTNSGGAPSVTWQDAKTIDLTWDGLFTANSELVYQVNIGSAEGGMDILPVTELTVAHLMVTDVDSSPEYFLSVTAVNQAGLYTTRTYDIGGSQ